MCLKPDTYSEPSQRFKTEFFAKIVKNYNYFFKALHLRSLTEFLIHLSLNKYSLTRAIYFMIHIQNPVYYRKFRHIQTCSRPLKDIFSHIVAYLEPCVTLAYSEPCHIQNSGVFRT